MFHVKHLERVKDMKKPRISEEMELINTVKEMWDLPQEVAEKQVFKLIIELEKLFDDTPPIVDMLNPNDFMPSIVELKERGL